MPTKPRNIRPFRTYNQSSALGTAAAIGGIGVIAAALFALVAALWFGGILLVAWAADAVYSGIFEAQNSGPNIDYWPMVGLIIVIRMVLGGIVRVSKD